MTLGLQSFRRNLLLLTCLEICNVTEFTFESITIYKNERGNVLFPDDKEETAEELVLQSLHQPIEKTTHHGIP
nr:hypothetical protein CFP56_49201 [Quercus suber]